MSDQTALQLLWLTVVTIVGFTITISVLIQIPLTLWRAEKREAGK